MPTPRAHLAVVTDGTYVYALGGDTIETNDGKVATVERFDPSTLTWSTMAPMPAAGNFIVAGVLRLTIEPGVFNPTIVVVGSGDADGPSAATYVYDIGLMRGMPAHDAGASRVMAGPWRTRRLVGGRGTVNGSWRTRRGSTTWRRWRSRKDGRQRIDTDRALAACRRGRERRAVRDWRLDDNTSGAAVSTNTAHSTPPVEICRRLSRRRSNCRRSCSGRVRTLYIRPWRIDPHLLSGHDEFRAQRRVTRFCDRGVASPVRIRRQLCDALKDRGRTHDRADAESSPLNDQTREANSSSGAIVTYFASASDSVDGQVPAICSPVSGVNFPFGPTTVNCSATDSHSNTRTGSFTITVQDTHAPFLNLPGNQTRDANSASGAIVNYSASANDSVDGHLTATCSPGSGVFPFGTTTVNCSASDSHHNTTTGSFAPCLVRDITPPSLNVPHSR
jgi:hypothetical protein